MGNEDREELHLTEWRLPLRDLSPPEPGSAHLWLVDLARLGSPLQPDLDLTSTPLPVRQRRTLRRFYLRLLLGAYLDLPGKDIHLVRSERGKPVLDPRYHPVAHDSRLDFSMAASDGFCLIGVTSGSPIGVDLEPRGRKAGKPLALARRYFSPDEYEALANEPEGRRDEAFLHTWACKEAVVKAGGTGIANMLCRFSVEVRPDRASALLAMEGDDAAAWQLRSVVLPGGWVGAVTVRYPSLVLDGRALLPRS
ncbi:MAG: 4'-phosphopantetheinyl transferase superfamily protein [Xanthomonadales bacterium]|jgi:4'-phosphopantetheinyl transferase|nr:4'-phosphopantetheinyl transferase superfamily protein [Xanthomonadales bacterium]